MTFKFSRATLEFDPAHNPLFTLPLIKSFHLLNARRLPDALDNPPVYPPPVTPPGSSAFGLRQSSGNSVIRRHRSHHFN